MCACGCGCMCVCVCVYVCVCVCVCVLVCMAVTITTVLCIGSQDSSVRVSVWDRPRCPFSYSTSIHIELAYVFAMPGFKKGRKPRHETRETTVLEGTFSKPRAFSCRMTRVTENLTFSAHSTLGL